MRRRKTGNVFSFISRNVVVVNVLFVVVVDVVVVVVVLVVVVSVVVVAVVFVVPNAIICSLKSLFPWLSQRLRFEIYPHAFKARLKNVVGVTKGCASALYRVN